MKKDNIRKLSFDDDFLLDSAQQRYEEGDFFGALKILNKREAMHEPLADAYAIYADVYEALELWSLAADAWYRFLDTCNEADFPEGYEGLAICFMNMGNDFQSGFFYHRALSLDGYDEEDCEDVLDAIKTQPTLRLIHNAEEAAADPETIAEGLALMRIGDLGGAERVFSEVEENSTDYPSAQGLAAMCALMMGEEQRAEETSRALAERFPANVQVLTTYCAVLGAKERYDEAKEVAKALSRIETSSTDDLYRIATALCETGLDALAKEKLELLKKRLPYDENVLWFHAVAAYHVGDTEGAIESLELLTLLFPRKAVAAWYLENMRAVRDEGGELRINYFYRLPQEKYKDVASYFLEANTLDAGEGEELAKEEEFKEYFFLAFDEMEGRDEKLQLLAAKVAARFRADSLIRAVLLDCNGDEMVKFSILHDLVCRNEDNSFGTVLCNLYKEFFTHEIEIGKKKGGPFMQAFADVYSKYALLGEEYERKICAAGEEIYEALAEEEGLCYADERGALAAAIYREARMRKGERSFAEICKMFDADKIIAEHILDYML